MFSLIYLGDWVSWHLAVLNKTDPTPVPVIQQLKTRLAKAR
jgi:glucose/mannose-6-phosphate isomerase